MQFFYRAMSYRLACNRSRARTWAISVCSKRNALSIAVCSIDCGKDCRIKRNSSNSVMTDSGGADVLQAPLAALQVADAEEKINADIAPYSASYQRILIKSVLTDADTDMKLVGNTFRVGGWVRTGREAGAGAFAFLQLNDGTSFDSLQVMVTKEVAEASGFSLKLAAPTGTSLLVEGELQRTPEGTQQKVELKAARLLHLGPCDNSAGQYPFAKKKQTLEFLREKAHLRPRTATIGAVARVRNALAFATHEFFQAHGFMYVHTPVITTSDAEGAGELFQVTTLLGRVDEMEQQRVSPDDVEAKRREAEEKREEVGALREKAPEGSDKKDHAKKLKQQGNLLAALEADLVALEKRQRIVGGVPRLPGGAVDYSDDFFGRSAFLTVSGQIQGEYYACGLSNIYTFGPTFRAENSHTSRHLAEFWMIEPEIAFCNLSDDMRCAEDYVRFCCKSILRTCRSDLEFLQKNIDPHVIERLEHVASVPFKRLSYTEAVDILTAAVREKKKKFENPKVKWGDDLASEHERYLTEDVFRQPVIVHDYPAEIKAFYMRLNDDGKTVAAMDLLVPGVGELIGGSQREDRLEILEQRMRSAGLDVHDYEPYIDLRKYGSVPHAGFGLGFERLVLFATGLENIRDVIPFPRWPGQARF